MSTTAIRPMCFIAMPFGKREAEGGATVDFDRIHDFIHQGAEAAGLESIRADFEPAGGFIHKPMLERLLVAEYVIADLTLSNPNVMYEVGVRHGASARSTLLICGDQYVGKLPFDFKPLRVLPYDLGADGTLSDKAGADLAEAIRDRMTKAKDGELPGDNPLMQITAWKPAGSIEHSKTDVFLQRLEFTGQIGERIKAAISLGNKDQALSELSDIEKLVIDLSGEIAQVHTALLGLYLAYREKGSYDRMAALFQKFPRELKRTPVAREQYALALNRLAEQAAKGGEHDKADELRKQAIDALDRIPAESVTSETYGIRGRIYKGWHDAMSAVHGPGDPHTEAKLERAIDTYEKGFRADMRDYYPGVNAVTLRLLRGQPADGPALKTLIPVVRYSVSAAPAPKNEEERYWQTATRLELATADKDWEVARRVLTELLGIGVADWFRKTTAENMKRQQSAMSNDANAVREIERIVKALSA